MDGAGMMARRATSYRLRGGLTDSESVKGGNEHHPLLPLAGILPPIRLRFEPAGSSSSPPTSSSTSSPSSSQPDDGIPPNTLMRFVPEKGRSQAARSVYKRSPGVQLRLDDKTYAIDWEEITTEVGGPPPLLLCNLDLFPFTSSPTRGYKGCLILADCLPAFPPPFSSSLCSPLSPSFFLSQPSPAAPSLSRSLRPSLLSVPRYSCSCSCSCSLTLTLFSLSPSPFFPVFLSPACLTPFLTVSQSVCRSRNQPTSLD